MKEDVTLLRTIDRLVEASRDNDAPVWRDLAERLRGPTRQRAEVNVSSIERNADEGDTVVVPGKVLGSGRLTKPVTVAAFDFSKGAVERIEASGGRSVPVEVLLEEEPKGSGVRIFE